MSEWEVVIERPADRYLAKMPVTQRQRILDALLVLETKLVGDALQRNATHTTEEVSSQ